MRYVKTELNDVPPVVIYSRRVLTSKSEFHTMIQDAVPASFFIRRLCLAFTRVKVRRCFVIGVISRASLYTPVRRTCAILPFAAAVGSVAIEQGAAELFTIWRLSLPRG